MFAPVQSKQHIFAPHPETPSSLLSWTATRRTLSMGQEWSETENQTELHYSYRVICDRFYHGETCSTFCRPRNDTHGHFVCDEEGRRHCMEGWRGEYCSQCECAPELGIPFMFNRIRRSDIEFNGFSFC